MKERSIIFSAPMVRAILEGRKTQTRRVIKDSAGKVPDYAVYWDQDSVGSREPRGPDMWRAGDGFTIGWLRCPFGAVGTRLWVRETWKPLELPLDHIDGVRFAADNAFVPIANTPEAADAWVAAANNDHSGRWRTPIYMPRWASRLTLEVTSVRIERLQSITEEDIFDEGLQPNEAGSFYVDEEDGFTEFAEPRDAFAYGWDGINGRRAPWEANPWVWRVAYRRVA